MPGMILCSPARTCPWCRQASATKACDYVVGVSADGKQTYACDRAICAACAQQVGPNVDYCPKHAIDVT